jgi:hypothetical protein
MLRRADGDDGRAGPDRPGRAAPSGKRDHGPVVEGCQIRELPDGGSEFVLDEPALSFIRVDYRSKLQFGRTEVVIGGPFELEINGVVHHLDPQRWDALGPLVALFPGSVRWLWASAQGDLTAVFEGGAKVMVAPDAMSKAWSVGNVYCVPAGPA